MQQGLAASDKRMKLGLECIIGITSNSTIIPQKWSGVSSVSLYECQIGDWFVQVSRKIPKKFGLVKSVTPKDTQVGSKILLAGLPQAPRSVPKNFRRRGGEPVAQRLFFRRTSLEFPF